MTTEFLQHRNTAAVWTFTNPILGDGEIGIDTTAKIFKLGDGVHHWNDLKLSYILKSILTTKGDLLVGTGPSSAGRLPRGLTGQALTIDTNGNLVWADIIDPANYELASHAASTFETQVDADATHAGFITSTDMANTYESLAESNYIHGQFETFVHSSATYLARTTSDATYEPLWLTITKQLTQTLINNGVLTADDELFASIAANAVYIFELLLTYEATVAGKMKFTLSGPTGATTSWGVHGPVAAMTSGADSGDTHHEAQSGSPQAAAVVLGGAGITSPLFATVRGVIHTSTTAGLLSLKFSQNTATNDAGAEIKSGSYLRVRRVS